MLVTIGALRVNTNLDEPSSSFSSLDWIQDLMHTLFEVALSNLLLIDLINFIKFSVKLSIFEFCWILIEMIFLIQLVPFFDSFLFCSEDIKNPNKIFAWNCEKQHKFIERGRGSVLTFFLLVLGVVNGLTKNYKGLAKFQLNCRCLTVSFSEQFFASWSLAFFQPCHPRILIFLQSHLAS